MDDANQMTILRTTLPDEAAAKQWAKRLVDEGHAVCVHVWPMTSTYRWDDDTVQEGEWMVEARATADAAEACWLAMREGHPYDVPLVEWLADTRVNGAYARWANAST